MSLKGLIETELKICASVVNGTPTEVEHTPANAKTVWINVFCGDAAYCKDALIHIEWDGAVIWTIRGCQPMPFKHEITGADGSKKVKMIATNDTGAAIHLSGFAKIIEY